MSPPIINSPTNNIRSAIRFLSAKGVKAVELHLHIREMYGETILSDRMVQKWVRAFKNGRTNVPDEERSK